MGSVALGLMPIAGLAAMSTNPGAVTDHSAPERSKRIGDDSTPRNFPTRGDKAAMGPPADPLAIEVMASRCSALARASTITPTDQLPLPISSGVKRSTMKPRPSRETVPWLPCPTWNAMATVHDPLVGLTASCPEMQGHTKSQLQFS